MLSDLTIQQIGMRLVAMVVIAGIYGAVVAGTAVLLGDKGPRHDGRLTLMPVAHLDVIGTVAAVVFGMGWIKPVAIDCDALRPRRAGLVFVVLAGTIALVLTVLVLPVLARLALEGLSYSAGISVAATLRVAAQVCLWTAVLNLLPVPPLTGAHLLAAFGLKVPKRAVWIGTTVLVALLWTGIVQSALEPLHDLVSPALLGAALSGR